MRTSVDVHNFLQSQGIPHEISLIEVPTKTTAIAASLLGLDRSEVGKTLLVEADGRPMVVVLPGDRRLDTRKLKRITGAGDIKFAEPEAAASMTGYFPHNVPPIAHASDLPIYVDIRLLSVPLIYTCGGQDNTVLKIKPVDLISAGSAHIVDIADDSRV